MSGDGAELPEGLLLLANDAMRARRRPFAILAIWLYESVLALVLAWPIASVVRGVYGTHPRGDAVLWSPGSIELMDLLEHTRSAQSSITALAIAVGVVAAVLGLIPLGALLTSIAYATRLRRAPSASQAILGGVRAFLPMLLLLVVASIAEGIFLGGGMISEGGVSAALTPGMGDARAQQIGWMVLVVFVVGAAFVGVFHDLARAAIVRLRGGFLPSVKVALATLRRAPLSFFWSWAWRALAACLPIAVGSFVADKIGGHGGGALLALLIVHQIVVVSRVALRASWLAKAMRAVDVTCSGEVSRPESAPATPAPGLGQDPSPHVTQAGVGTGPKPARN